MDVESLLRSAELPDVSVDTEAALVSTARAGRNRRRRRTAFAGSAGACAVVGVTILLVATFARTDDRPGLDVTTGPNTTVPTSGSWRPLAPSPLRARDQGVAVWTGSEVVIAGGSDTTPCSANTDCLVALAPLADGAAYNPVSDSWRRIADAPVPFVGGIATWTGTEVLLLAKRQDLNTPDVLLAYDPKADRWAVRADPPVDGVRSMAWTGDAWAGIAPQWRGGAHAWRYRPALDAWEPIAPDPIGELSDRSLVWTGAHLVLLGSRYGPDPANGFWEAAILQPDGSWRQVSRSDIANNGQIWSAIDGDVVNLGTGRHNSRETGGVLDPQSGSWSHLPPETSRTGGSTGYQGVAGPWVVAQSRLFDPVGQQWRPVEDRLDQVVPGVAALTGDEIVSWGGTIQHSSAVPDLVASGFAFRPPAPARSDPSSRSTSVPLAAPEKGDLATWDIDPAAPPLSGSSTFTARVTRLACSGGFTGRVLRPGVVVTDTEIVVTATVEVLPPGELYSCPGNEVVPYTVDIGQPIGARNLVDGACIGTGRGKDTNVCSPTANPAVRWRSDGAGRFGGDFTVSGRMESRGGPPGAGPEPATGTVRALDVAGNAIASAETDSAGAFQLAVPNGTYRVVGRSPSYQEGQADCVADDNVIVNDFWVDNVTVVCRRK